MDSGLRQGCGTQRAKKSFLNTIQRAVLETCARVYPYANQQCD